MVISRIIKTLFQSNKNSCTSLYKQAKQKRPGKADKEYLKFVLLSKSPFDYQEDRVIENILNVFNTIEDLESFISDIQKDVTFWAMRRKNLKRKSNELTIRNNEFFKVFWS